MNKFFVATSKGENQIFIVARLVMILKTVQIPKFLSTDCSHFLSKILQVDPHHRYNIQEIRQHPWFRQFKDKAPEGLFPTQEFMPLNNVIYE